MTSFDAAEKTPGQRELIAAFFAAIVFRLVFLGLVAHTTTIGDAYWYDHLAKNLWLHQTFSLETTPPLEPTVYRPPLYPMFIAVIYALTGGLTEAARIVQIVLDAGCITVFALALRTLNGTVARWTLWGCVFNPSIAVYAGALLSEGVTTSFLVLASALPLLVSGRVRWLAMGLALGGAAMCRDVFLALIPFWAVLPWVPKVRTWLQPIIPEAASERRWASALLVIGALMVISPWTMRNATVAGKLIPVSKGILGQGLWIGTWETSGDWQKGGALRTFAPPATYRSPEERKKVEAAIKLQNQPRDAAMMALAIDRYKTEPFRVIGRWFARMPIMWFGTRFEAFSFAPEALARKKPGWWAMKASLWLVNFAVIVTGVLGFIWALVRRSRLLWFTMPVIYTAGIFLPLHSTESRYSAPALPGVLVMSAALLIWTGDWLKARRA